MVSKRGQAFVGRKLVNIILGIMLLLLIVVVSVTLVRTFFPAPECDNAAEWKVVRSTLAQLESGSREKVTIPFNNGNCPLAGFSPNQIYTVAPGSTKQISERPLVCMCEIEQARCNPFEECYTLTKFDSFSLINSNDQFTTKDQRNQMFITFVKKDRALEAFILGVQRENKEYSVPSELVIERDSSSTLASVTLYYDLKEEIRLESVTTTGSVPFTPSGSRIVSTGNFPYLFDVKFVVVGEERPLDLSKVNSANMTVYVDLTDLDALSEQRRESIALHYKKGESWTFVPLVCDRTNSKVRAEGTLYEGVNQIPSGVQGDLVIPCAADLDGFSENFAIAPVSGGIA